MGKSKPPELPAGMTARLWQAGQVTVPAASRSQLLAASKKVTMNWKDIEANWGRYKGLVKHRWGKLDDAFLEASAGRREPILGRIQEEYGISRSESEELLAAWLDAQD